MTIPNPATTEWVPIWNPQNAGPVGPAGPGVPAGGTTSQVLTKNSATDYDTIWAPAGTPGAHHATHETGGTDAIAALSGAVITTGTVADARLSSNVALKNINNGFVAQDINSYLVITHTASPQLFFYEGGRPANQGRWRLIGYSGGLTIQPLDDNNTPVSDALALDRVGNTFIKGVVYERARLVPMGEWATWTVNWITGTSVNIGNGSLVGKYTYVGKTCYFRILLTWGSTTTVGAGDANWLFSPPIFPVSTDFSHLFPTLIMDIPAGTPYGDCFSNFAGNSYIIPFGKTLAGGAGYSYVNSTFPITWGTGDTLTITGFYEF